MLNSKFKNTLENYGPLRFSFDYENAKWTINITFKDPDLINPVWEGFYETEKINDILINLMPGILLFEEDSEAKLENDNSVFSFKKTYSKSTIVLYEGEILKDCLQINETSFENDLDFYISIFRNFEDIELSHSTLKECGISTPIELLSNALKNINWSVVKIMDADFDDDGYKFHSFHIQDDNGLIYVIDYPQPDPIIGSFPINSIEDFIENTLSSSSGLIEILESIDDNTLENYIKSNGYQI